MFHVWLLLLTFSMYLFLLLLFVIVLLQGIVMEFDVDVVRQSMQWPCTRKRNTTACRDVVAATVMWSMPTSA